jgi:hypothetical protein
VDDALRAQRLESQWVGRTDPVTVHEVVRHLVAVQAQNLPGALLALHARSPQVNRLAVLDAVESGEFVVSWLNRGTLHLVAREDFWSLQTHTAKARQTQSRSRVRRAGISDSDAGGRVERIVALCRGSQLTKAEILAGLSPLDVASGGSATTHLLEYASALGRLVRGPARNGVATIAVAEEWVGPVPPQLTSNRSRS